MKTVLTVILLLLKFTSLFSQEAKKNNSDSLQYDFLILKTTLKENHPIMFSYISESRFDSLTNNISNEISKGITLTRFRNLTSQFLAEIKCGHTYANLISYSKSRMDLINDLPFEIAVIDASVYISRVYGKEYEKHLGKKITGINVVPMPQILQNAASYIPSDGSNITYKRFRFENKFNYYVNLVLNFPDALTFELEQEKFTIAFPTGFTKPQQEEPEAGFFELPGSNKSVVFTLPDFDSGKRIIRKCFSHLSKSQAQNLIIDLRNNGGGNGNTGSYLISHLIDSTVTHYLDKKTNEFKYKTFLKNGPGFLISNQFIVKDSITRSYYFKDRPRKKNHFTGNVYVLTNGGTFSTAAFVASILQHKTGAILAGEETGGSEYAIGGGVMSKLILPYSQLRINFPMYKWRFNATNKQTGTGVLPDIYLKRTRPNPNDKTDSELARLSELIAERKVNPEQSTQLK